MINSDLDLNLLNINDSNEENTDDEWTDMMVMFHDIRGHAQNNGRSIVEEDRIIGPGKSKFAWRCTNTGKTWSIKISTFEQCVKELDPINADIIHRAIQTQEGKQNLTASLNSK